MSAPVTEQAVALTVEATSRELHLPTVRQQAAALAEAALRERLSHLGYLAEVLQAELDDRDERRRERRIREARFPRLKYLADFDLAAAPTVDPTMLATLERGEWIAQGEPVVLLGDSGTGKSHLLIGLGMAACQRGLRVRYTTAAQLVNELAEAADERTLSRLVARYGRLDLLCLDEFGYVHLDPRGAELLFQILTEREERASVAVASNAPFSDAIERIGFGAFYSRRCGLTPGEFARRIEELGFDGFWAGETPTNRDPSLDSFTTLCFAAAATSRITVGSDVLLLPLHHPAWVAKQFGTLDVLSNGRAILGVGVGGEYPKQFEGFGIPLHERGRRTDEGIEIIRSLWTEQESSYHSPRFEFEGITMEPKPVQQPHPPIWVGGRPGGVETGPDGKPRFKSTTGAIQRAAKYTDAWDPYYMTPEMYRESVTQIRARAAEIGRDISGMGWALTTFWQMRDSYDEALETAAGKLRYGRDLSARIARYDILGSPADVISRLETFIDAGVRYFICNWSCDPSEVPRHLELIGNEVIPHFR